MVNEARGPDEPTDKRSLFNAIMVCVVMALAFMVYASFHHVSYENKQSAENQVAPLTATPNLPHSGTNAVTPATATTPK